MSSNLMDFLIILSMIISLFVLDKLFVRVFKIKEATALLLSFITLAVPILLLSYLFFGLEGALEVIKTIPFLGVLVGIKLLIYGT